MTTVDEGAAGCAQMLGFVLSAALCWRLAWLFCRSRDAAGPWGLAAIAAIAVSFWPFGQLLPVVVKAISPAAAPFALRFGPALAWSATAAAPMLLRRVCQDPRKAGSRWRRVGEAASTAGAIILVGGFAGRAALPHFPLGLPTLMILSGVNFIVQSIALLASLQAAQGTAGSRLVRRVTAAAGLAMALLLVVAMTAPPDRLWSRFVTVAAEQSIIPAAILAAGMLARFRYADVLLKSALQIVAAFAIAAALVAALVGTADVPGFTLACLAAGAILLAVPAVRHGIDFAVDRLLLHRPRYRDEIRRLGADLVSLVDAAAIQALTLQRAAAALNVPMSAVAFGSERTLEIRVTGRSPRRLLDAECIFLDALGAEANRRLQLLALERERAAAQMREEVMRRSVAEARLTALRAQVDPHFLFNALNAIADLIARDSAAAERMTEHLAEFFRYTLAGSDKAAATIAEEFHFVRHYLEIERVRFGARLRVEIRVDPAVAGISVPALILQPLVENAVRHGLAPKAGGGSLLVSAMAEGAAVALRVRDDGLGMGEERPAGRGAGLRLVRERLEAAYGSRATLDVASSTSGGGTDIILRIPSACPIAL